MAALTPYLCVADARAAIDWYTAHLGPEDSSVGRVAVLRDPFGHRWLLNQQAG